MLDLKQGALYGMSQAQGGDTLSKIAKTFYGDPKAYPKIFDSSSCRASIGDFSIALMPLVAAARRAGA